MIERTSSYNGLRTPRLPRPLPLSHLYSATALAATPVAMPMTLVTVNAAVTVIKTFVERQVVHPLGDTRKEAEIVTL